MNPNLMSSLFPRLPEHPCCNNCDETLNQEFKPSEELKASVAAALSQWRIDVLHTYYPEQHIITFKHLLDNTVIEKISACPSVVKQRSIFQQVIPWALGVLQPDMGDEVVNLVTELVRQDPDQVAREMAEQERHGERLLMVMAKDYREKLLKLFSKVYKSVCNVTTGSMLTKTVDGKRVRVPKLKCRMFKQLPSSLTYPAYYEQIQDPISLAQIGQQMRGGPTKSYPNLQTSVHDWCKMFTNARSFNMPGSEIYQYATELEETFDVQLRSSAAKYGIELESIGDTDLVIDIME
ncbi:zinc finger protein [Marasmius sp. AFHP31]|nr:zinc finger protein [Marasmius sp. AFHP31]